MIVNGFIEPLVKELPMEYAVEIKQTDSNCKWKAVRWLRDERPFCKRTIGFFCKWSLPRG